MPLIHYFQLTLNAVVRPMTIGRQIDSFGTAENADAASAGELRNIEGIGAAKAQKIHSSLRSSAAAAETEMAKARDLGIRLLCPQDPVYPLLLLSIPDPPPVLYVKGTLEPRDLNAFALV